MKNPVGLRAFAPCMAVALACLGAGRAGAQSNLTPVQDAVLAQLPAQLPDSQERARIFKGGKSAVENANKFKSLYSQYGKTGAENLLRMADATSKMAKLGKSLGMAGAAVGVGMGVLEMFGVVESDAAKTQRLLGEIAGKIDALEEKMNGRFDALEASLKKLDASVQAGFAKTQIFPHINRLDTIQGTVELYYEGLAAKNPNYAELDRLELSLTQIQPNDIKEAANAVHSCVLGKKFATNIVQAEYETSFGDMARLAETAALLTRIVNQAEHNYVLVQTLQLKRGDETSLKKAVQTAKDRVTRNPSHPYFKSFPLDHPQVEAILSLANREFGPKLEQIAAVLTTYARKAVAERQANARRFLEDRLGGKGNLTRTNPWNETAWQAQGEHLSHKNGSAGFKKLLPEPDASPELKRDYTGKYGSLAKELKAKYLCDWAVVVYHPMGIQSQRSFAGLANQINWNWHGSNYIWFLENDFDYKRYDGEHSQLMFVLFQSWDITEDAPAPPKVSLSKAQLDAADIDNHKQHFDEVKLLHDKMGANRFKNAGVDHMESGLALIFREGAPIKASAGQFHSFWATHYTAPTISSPRTGVIKSFGTHTGDHRGFNDGPYGSLYVESTDPRRMLVQQGKGKLVVLFSPDRTPVKVVAEIPDCHLNPAFGGITAKAGFKDYAKDLTAGGPLTTDLGGVKSHVTKEPSFRIHYTAGKSALKFRSESKGDTTLLINLPDGTWIANDDGGGGRNAQLTFAKPQTGVYDVYVGSFGAATKLPATLKITEVSTQAAPMLIRTGTFAGQWHSDKAQYTIDKVNADGTFTGKTTLVDGKFKGFVINFSGTHFPDHSIVLVRTDKVDDKGRPSATGKTVNQASSARAPQLAGGAYVWRGITSRPGPGQDIFELQVPKAGQ